MLALLASLGEITVVGREGAAIEVDVALPVEYPTLEHVLREAAARELRP